MFHKKKLVVEGGKERDLQYSPKRIPSTANPIDFPHIRPTSNPPSYWSAGAEAAKRTRQVSDELFWASKDPMASTSDATTGVNSVLQHVDTVTDMPLSQSQVGPHLRNMAADMVTLAIQGRQVWEDDRRRKFGPSLTPPPGYNHNTHASSSSRSTTTRPQTAASTRSNQQQHGKSTRPSSSSATRPGANMSMTAIKQILNNSKKAAQSVGTQFQMVIPNNGNNGNSNSMSRPGTAMSEENQSQQGMNSRPSTAGAASTTTTTGKFSAADMYRQQGHLARTFAAAMSSSSSSSQSRPGTAPGRRSCATSGRGSTTATSTTAAISSRSVGAGGKKAGAAYNPFLSRPTSALSTRMTECAASSPSRGVGGGGVSPSPSASRRRSSISAALAYERESTMLVNQQQYEFDEEFHSPVVAAREVFEFERRYATNLRYREMLKAHHGDVEALRKQQEEEEKAAKAETSAEKVAEAIRMASNMNNIRNPNNISGCNNNTVDLPNCGNDLNMEELHGFSSTCT